jgi:hypothetical protein
LQNEGRWKELLDLHLLKLHELDRPIAEFRGKGDNKVERVRYEEGRVRINNNKHFEGVPPEVWGYHTGGYQVCNKWLKDRMERILFLDDIRQYCKIVTSINLILCLL